MIFEKKICIGTVKFGLKYGLNNIKKIHIDEISKIFKYLNKSKIKFLDTAPSYGNSQKIIGKIKKKNFDIISKIYLKDVNTNIEANLKKTIIDLKSKKIYALLIHNSEILLKKEAYKIYKQLIFLKKKKLVKKIGISVYNPDVLKKIVSKYKFDIIQFQGNAIDRRFLNRKNLDHYKSLGIELHVRSIFLQGVLLKNKVPRKLVNSKKILNKFYNYMKKNNINPLDFCLSFILQFKQIDKIVVGIDNLKNLSQIISFKKIKKNHLIKNFSSDKQTLIDPRKW